MQNNMMLPQGGLKTDGQQVDPVSGNQVPVGSNAKEVRDDIPAQLSQGEYVVPADIVRYYGVKFFEDLRNQGKGGLQHMAATGRIGGEPVPAGGPQNGPMGQPMMSDGGDLTPDEMNELRALMNVGGMAMPMQQQPMSDPYQQQSAMYQQPRGAALGADFGGGSFYNNPQAITTPTRYTGEFSWEQPRAAPAATTSPPVTLYCPDGSVNTLQLPADQARYDELIQNGCGLDSSILPTSATDKGSESSSATAGTTSGDPDDPAPWTDKYGYPKVVVGEMYPDATTSYQNILDKSMSALTGEDDNYLQKLFTTVLGGGAVGKFLQGTTHAQVAANIAILNANLGSLTPEQQKQLKDLEAQLAKFRKANGLDLLPKEFINGDQLAIAASGKSYMTLLNRDSKDVFGKAIFDPSSEIGKTGQFEDYVNKNNIQFENKAMNITAGNTVGNAGQTISQQEGYKDLQAAAKASGNEDIIKAVEEAGSKTLDQMIKESGGTGSLVDTGKQNLSSQDVVGATFKQGESAAEKQIAAEVAKAADLTTADYKKIGGDAFADIINADLGLKAAGTTLPEKGAADAAVAEALGYTGSDDSAPKGIIGNNTTGKNTPAQDLANALTPGDGKEYVGGVLVKTDDKPATTTKTTTAAKDTSGTTVESVKTTNAVNNTGSDVTIGKTTAGGQDAGDGFVWEKKEGTNAITRKWVGTSDSSSSSSDSSSSSSSSSSNDGCCFIMLEARYGNGIMDEVVRRYRDEYMTDRNRRGYYRLAEVLVPLMRKSKAFKWVITKTFADPLVSYGKYYYGQNKHGVLYSPVKNFWMKVFDIIGGDTKFIRENGEVV